MLRRIKVHLHKMAFSLPHAHVNYISAATDIFGSYGVPQSRIFITYNSPDTDILLRIREKINDPPLLPVNEFRIIHVGRLVRWKRVDLLIRSLHAIRSDYPAAELVVVGDGPMKMELVALANHLGMGNCVIFRGAVYDAENARKIIILLSSVYVLAGMGGLSINDAMCFSKPIICSICDGTERMLVRDGVNGLLFRDGGDLQDLTSKILYLFHHPYKRRSMGIKSTQIIRNEINVHTVLKGYLHAFDFVMNQGRRRITDKDPIRLRRHDMPPHNN